MPARLPAWRAGRLALPAEADAGVGGGERAGGVGPQGVFDGHGGGEDHAVDAMGGEGVDGALPDAAAEDGAAALSELDEAAVAAAGLAGAVTEFAGVGVEVDDEEGRAARQVIRDRNAVGRRDRDAIGHYLVT